MNAKTWNKEIALFCPGVVRKLKEKIHEDYENVYLKILEKDKKSLMKN